MTPTPQTLDAAAQQWDRGAEFFVLGLLLIATALQQMLSQRFTGTRNGVPFGSNSIVRTPLT